MLNLMQYVKDLNQRQAAKILCPITCIHKVPFEPPSLDHPMQTLLPTHFFKASLAAAERATAAAPSLAGAAAAE